MMLLMEYTSAFLRRRRIDLVCYAHEGKRLGTPTMVGILHEGLIVHEHPASAIMPSL